jgi:ankyrin repeat protein
MDQNRFLEACKTGDITTLKSLDFSKINIHAGDEWAFRLTCINGHLNIVKFLISLEPEYGRIDIHARDENAFRWSCYNGHLSIVQFLLTLQPEYGRINIHTCDEFAFRSACQYGRLDIVKYLVSLQPEYGRINIHAENERAFQLACVYGHPQIVKLLLSLEPEYGRIDIHAWNGNEFKYGNFQIRYLLIQRDPNYNWKQVEEYSDYINEIDQIINNLSLLHQKMIQIDTDILELNVIGIVQEFLLG